MPRKDIRRERIAEKIEAMIREKVNFNELWFEDAVVDLESDGHITLTYNPSLRFPAIYDIKISRRRR
jgi:hypothetical protein